LPAIRDCLDEDIELSPLAESDPIVTDPPTSDLLDRIYITENLGNISLFPGDIFLDFEWESLVFFDSFEIFID
jgi:hypothetical protein